MTSKVHAVALAVLACVSCAAAQKVLPPADAGEQPLVLVFSGRPDAAEDAYVSLLQEVQEAALGLKYSVWVVTGASFSGMSSTVTGLKQSLREKHYHSVRVFYMGHGMVDGSGSAAAPTFASSDPDATGVVLLAGFLTRTLRPSVAACVKKWEVQPTHRCPKGKGLPFCPGGYLPDDVHECSGGDRPTPDYKLPSLTVGGGLDGVVRVARIAEAWYTQQSTPQHEVAIVEGMNHADLMAQATESIAAVDLLSEVGPVEAKQRVASLVAQFFVSPGASGNPLPDAFFKPFEQMFVEQEGSWWWTSNFDEKGSSQWAADAQRKMCEPMPEGFDEWSVSNEFRLLSDEDAIPPYYRDKHRPNVTMSGKTVVGHSVAQLRYLELTPSETAIGLNGWAIIKEEKASVLSKVKDDGGDYTSAIEIGTKLASRQLAYNSTGSAAPDSLDDGDRCKAINQAAYDLALQSASPTARARFNAQGRPMVMVADKKPFPPAGPWWIWNYLNYNDKGSAGLEVQSWYAFYSLTAFKYGAGNHYCKLLSPARALEWVYTDGMRKLKDSSQLLV